MTDHRTGSPGKKDADQLGRNTAPLRESRSVQRKRRRRRRRLFWSSVAATAAGTLAATAVIVGVPRVVHMAEGVFSSPATPRETKKPGTERRSTPQKKGNRSGATPFSRGHVRAGPALKIVSAYPMDSWAIRAWVFPHGFVPSPNLIAQLDDTLRQPALMNRALFDAGGDPPSVDTQFIFHNNRPYPVIISDIQVSKSCQAPYSGTIFDAQTHITSAGVGPSGRQWGIDLDSSNPEVMVAKGWDISQWTHEYASGPPATIPAHGSYEFDLRAIALHHACGFWLVLTVVDGGSERSLTFGDYGTPFRVSALLPGALRRKKPNDHPYVGYRRLYVGAAAR
jgi:hypothetical protein